MKLHKFALAVFLGAASMAASATNATPNDKGKPGHPLQILTPKFGQNITGTNTAVRAVLRAGEIRPDSLRLALNGRNVTRLLRKGECQDDACKWTVELTKADGLHAGRNRLVAHARGPAGSLEMQRVNFQYYYGLQGGQDLPYYLPSTVGLSLNPGGAQPWVTLTTGTPSNLQDNADRTQYSLPQPDTTFPMTTQMPCTSRYQVVVLNRLYPAQEDGYMCPGDASTLKSDLAGLTKGTELVLVGTTLNNNADAGLDTTSIGGTNYSASNSWKPMGYAAIGVSGAAPGSAYESYYIASDVGKAYQANPFAKGLLGVDQYGNYNFHAGDDIQFEVYPNDPDGGTSLVFVAEGKTIHGWNPPAGSNGFWLLILDRVTSLPIDASYASGSPCQPYSDAETCGTFYPTGSTDPAVASKAVNDLAFAMEPLTSRQLVVLTTLGQPFQTASAAANLAGAPVWNWYGAPPLALQALATPGSTYTLVAPGPQTSPVFSTELLDKTPFSKGVVNSSSGLVQQGQTGIVRGVMARDNNSLYFPAVVSQEDGKMNGDGATALSIDYDFYSITSRDSSDWPLTDTSGHIAAYHWASQQFLQYEKIVTTGSYLGDLRYFYGSSYSAQIASHTTDFNCSPNPTEPNCVYPGDTLGFTPSDLADVNAELYTEVGALASTYGYLSSEDGLYGLIQAGGVNNIPDAVIDATFEVLNGQVGASPDTGANVSMYEALNYLAGITSMFTAGVGPESSIAGAAVGVISGALWTGSALQPWWEAGDSPTPPSYENTFDTTLGTLQNNASTYAQNLETSYATSLDAIYADWGKLSATGAKTQNSNSGWQFSNEVVGFGLVDNFKLATRRSMYIQLLPKFYKMDTYGQQPVSDISKLGMFYSVVYEQGFQNQCIASYPSSISSLGYAVSVDPLAAGKSDIRVIGGTINNQGQYNVSESLPSDLLLNTLFDSADNAPSGVSPLNIPSDYVYGTALLAGRSGPSEGTSDGISQCYKPGCSDFTYGLPHTSSCINP